MDGVAITAVLAGTGGIITLFIKYISSRDVAQEKRDEVFAQALNANTEAMKAVAASTEIATAEAKLGRAVQEKGFAEAEKRNGHLAEISVTGNQGIMNSLAIIKGTMDKSAAVLKQNTKEVASSTKEVAEALASKDAERMVEEQTVTNQTVENQTVRTITKAVETTE